MPPSKLYYGAPLGCAVFFTPILRKFLFRPEMAPHWGVSCLLAQAFFEHIERYTGGILGLTNDQ